MPDVSVALDAVAARHQAESDRLSTALEYILMDLMVRIGPQTNVTEWAGMATNRLEAGARSYANLTTGYLDTQLRLLSPAPPVLPSSDLSWVRSDLDQWVPAPMVEVAGRVQKGEDINEVIADVTPQVRREVTAFVNEVEARVVEDVLDNLEEFPVFISTRPTMREIQRGLVELEDFANAGYDISKDGGTKLKIMIQPQIGACGFCVIRADRLYSADVLHGDRIRSHAFCRCGWRYASEAEAKSFESVLGGPGQKWKQVIDRRASPDPNVPVEGDLTP